MFTEKRRLIVLFVYAIAMAWLESATVVYLRTLIGRINPYQPDPLALSAGLPYFSGTESIREACTLLMLLAVGWLAGRTWRSRVACFMIAFGVWDIFYYVFLAVIGPWPRSVLDWDVLFLIPLPWWGPVLAPVLISLILIVSGVLVCLYDRMDRPFWPRRWAQGVSLLGIGLALYLFMEDSIHAILSGNGLKALGGVLPAQFNWPFFVVALVLMAAPLVDLVRQIRRRPV